MWCQRNSGAIGVFADVSVLFPNGSPKSMAPRQGFDDFITTEVNNYVEPIVGRKYMSHDILKALKPKIKHWVALNKSNEESRKKDLTNDLRTLDDKIEAGLASNEDCDNRIKILQEMHYLVNLEPRRFNGIMHDGVWITNPNQIKEAFFNFFKEKFQANDSTVTFPPTSLPNTLHQFDCDYLEASLTMDEVKNAIWDCGSDKAPGPDGYNFAFLKRYWDIIKQGIFEFVSAFLNSKKMPSCANSSFITLIPKITNPIHIKDYRPISLIGIHYKIIAKILANRLSVVIDKLISHEQTSFIKGRQILDCPLILSELIEWYKKRKKKMLLFKVDFEKAFDTVSWKYLDFMLHSLDFGLTWRSWIKAYLESSRTSVLINGSPTSEFNVRRGLRQGDPLSPFLFIIIMEGLHVAIFDSTHQGLIRGCNMSLTANWKPLIDKFKGKLSTWKAIMLSFGGRLTLIKSILGSLGIYYLSIFKAPKMVLKSLENMRAAFFWGGTIHSRKLAWVKWQNIVASFKKGGLNIRRLKAFNLALLQKWRWRIFSNSSALWVNVIKALHGSDGGFGYNGCSSKGLWAQIVGSSNYMHSSNILPIDSIRFQVGCGFSRLFRLKQDKDCLIMDRIANGQWVWNWSSNLGVRNIAHLNELLLDMSPLNIQVDTDKCLWFLDKEGVFAVAPLRRLIDDITLPSLDFSTSWDNAIPRGLLLHVVSKD
ncbi:putative RNA-directed DNA polymerase, eukaryota, reverse transcriptase zinc-binding domain protein [Tanacetum coccineum]